MNAFDIAHEVPGRMRVRLPHLLTFKQADLIQWALRKNPNIDQVGVLMRTSDVVITYHKLSREQLIEALLNLNLDDAELLAKAPDSGAALNAEYWDKLVSLVAGQLFRRLFFPPVLRNIVAVAKAVPFVVDGVRALFTKGLTVEVLDASALTAATATGDFATTGSISFLLRVGEILEHWTYQKSVSDLANAMTRNVGSVWRVGENGDEKVSINAVRIGDLIRAQMGKLIPLDGTVHVGEGMVNQAAMTGESIPVRKTAGSTVFAGTVLEEGDLVIEVKSAAGNTRYEKIMKMIDESERLKSEAQTHAENLADKLVPYTFLGSLATGLLTRDLAKAISVLMVDYSCALKLSAPISVLSAMREASAHHMTVKGGSFLEKIAQADTVIFDKTGTLTKAAPTVEAVYPTAGESADEALRVAACLEEHFPHSIANAVVRAAKARGLKHEEMHSKVEYLVAHGIVSSIDGKRAVIGSHHFVFEDEGISVTEKGQAILENIPDHYSHLYLGIDGELVAVICIADPIKPEAAQVIARLHEAGVKKCVMMTGDSERTARAIAAQAGIDEFHAEVLPEDKARYVAKEKAKGRTVLMVGDGINDSPALSEADVGIAIAEGADIAREIADVTVSENDLDQLVTLKACSDALMARLKNNRRAIISFNTGVMIAGALGLLTPGAAAVLHNTSTVAICLHSMGHLLNQT